MEERFFTSFYSLVSHPMSDFVLAIDRNSNAWIWNLESNSDFYLRVKELHFSSRFSVPIRHISISPSGEFVLAISEASFEVNDEHASEFVQNSGAIRLMTWNYVAIESQNARSGDLVEFPIVFRDRVEFGNTNAIAWSPDSK